MPAKPLAALACLSSLALPLAAHAENAAFDLTGPVLRVTVTRGAATLPLSQVPALASGDRIRIATDAPADRGARFSVVLAFLRGAVSPPPKDWLVEAQPWKPKHETIDAVVPDGAQQAAILLVPETGGATKAVSSALRGRPGAFVRAVQQLNQATLDRARLDAYLAAAGALQGAGPDAAARLATNLSVKIDPACLLRAPEVQAACLAQGGGAVLPDAETRSLAQTLAGTPADVALQASSTPQAGFGYYSPYIGLIRDFARILGAFQSAQLQFIPALEVERGAETRLLLDSAPSFRRPQSVLVAPLPAIGPAAPPPLRATSPDALCAARGDLLLPVTGAPLVFATGFVRDMALGVGGTTLDVPVAPDPVAGGYRIASGAAALKVASEGRLHGDWGFAPFEGPRFRFVSPDPAGWQVADRASLVVGRESPLVLEGGAAACVDEVAFERDGERHAVGWSVAGERRIALKVPLGDADPGALTLLVRSAGVAEPQRIAVKAYAEPSRLSGFTVYVGDREGLLLGTRLDQVAALELRGTTWRPDALSRKRSTDRLAMTTDAAIEGLHPGDTATARATLADGRSVPVRVTVAPPRPSATLVSLSVEPVGPAPHVPIATPANVVPQDARIVFSLRARDGVRLVPADQVEVATADGTATATLPLSLQDGAVAVARFVPGEALGPAGFGALRFRLLKDGTPGDWQPLATVVRLPAIAALACTAAHCTLTGERLFLLAGVSSGTEQVDVPDGFTGSSLVVPHPAGGRLRLRLRDAPATPASVALPG